MSWPRSSPAWFDGRPLCGLLTMRVNGLRVRDLRVRAARGDAASRLMR
jgi:hypothetical protein